MFSNSSIQMFVLLALIVFLIVRALRKHRKEEFVPHARYNAEPKQPTQMQYAAVLNCDTYGCGMHAGTGSRCGQCTLPRAELKEFHVVRRLAEKA